MLYWLSIRNGIYSKASDCTGLQSQNLSVCDQLTDARLKDDHLSRWYRKTCSDTEMRNKLLEMWVNTFRLKEKVAIEVIIGCKKSNEK